jgi:hypothetical protein
MPASRSLRRFAVTTAALVAAVFFFLLSTLPPNPFSIPLGGVDPALRARTVSGAYHVHTSRSDGAADKTSVAADAARAGLQFVIFTDHGDATRTPDRAVYLSGVLCIDAVEISTTRGHYVALDLPASPYPLGGEPSAVAEDVRRLGGFGIAAHPDHPKAGLSWTDWDVPIDGLEWLNADVDWRNESRSRLARVLFDYLVRPAPALVSLFDRPVQTFTHWDALERVRPTVGLAAADAHGGGRHWREEGETSNLSGGPGYLASFRSLSNRALLHRPLTGDAEADARLIIEAIRGGRAYSVLDAISKDVVLALDEAGRFMLVSPAPTGSTSSFSGNASKPRLELHTSNAPGDPPVPWVVGNWSGDRAPLMPPPALTSSTTEPIRLASEWRVEKDPESSGQLSGGREGVSLSYSLSPGRRRSQFVAAAADLGPDGDLKQIVFRGRADRPMRVAVQLRLLPDDARWVKSVYLEPAEREISLALEGFRPAENRMSGLPDIRQARSILFVVDLVNARPGDAGTLTVDGLRVSR